jgi:signal peptidase I
MSSGLSPRPGSEEESTDLSNRPAAPEESPIQTAVPPDQARPPGAGQARPPTAPARPKRRRFGFARELPFLLLVAFALALLIKTFLMQAFFIPSESMQNTLNPGDRVLVNKVVYHLHPPRRGDIIVFSDPNPVSTEDRNPVSAFWHWLTEGLGVTTNPEKDFIKRVIGLPGETVEGKDGVVYVDGKPLDEPYIRVKDARPFGPVQVPADSLFVMGDNRTDSKDSRYGLGFIPYDNVIGRAFVVIWPPSRIGWLRST